VDVLVLGEACLGGCDADVGHEEEFVAHVPSVAMHDHDERLAQEGAPSQRVDPVGIGRAPLARPQHLGEGIDVDATGEVLAVPEQHGGAKVVIGIVRGVSPCQGAERLGIDPVVNVGPVEADQADPAPSLDRDLTACRRLAWAFYTPFRGLRAFGGPTLGKQARRAPRQGRHDDRASRRSGQWH